MLAGLQELPANVVVTIGACVAPTEIGPLPDHIRVEQFISQELLLPECDLVVSHGGSGSLMGAFARGLPSVLLSSARTGRQRAAEDSTQLALWRPMVGIVPQLSDAGGDAGDARFHHRGPLDRL